MDVRGKKVTIVGMGRTALALTRLLLREGARPFVTEHKSDPRFDAGIAELNGLGVPNECGGHSAEAFEGAALVIPSPGVPPSIPVIAAAQAKGAAMMGEMEFASRFCRSRVLAVTGTNGKTTTTELLYAMVAACGRSVLLAGNNDHPLSEAVMADPAPEYIVLEVSSYQLETACTFRPWIGAVLNLTEDHLARHKTMENYAAAKASLFAHQGPGDAAIVNADDPWVRGMADGINVEIWPFSLSERQSHGVWLDGDTIRCNAVAIARLTDSRLPGRHNVQNVLAALAVMRAGGFEWEPVIDALRAFRGVEHRIELCAERDGIRFYNDSKSTNIDSLRVALQSFDEKVVLIAGGEGKGAPYEPLRELVAASTRHLVTIGDDAPLLESAFADIVPTERAASMEDAVARAARAAKPAGIVLLSPACASFDWYNGFEQRGRHFKDCVRAYLNGGAA